MQIQTNVDLGGVLVDIEFEEDQDIETGEWFFVEHGKILVGGVDITDALCAVADGAVVERKVFAALRASLDAEMRQMEAA